MDKQSKRLPFDTTEPRRYNPESAAPSQYATQVEETTRMKSSKKKWVLLGGISLGLLAVVAAGWVITHRHITPTTNLQTAKSQNAAASSSDNSIRILAAGDFIAHDSINMHAKKSDGSYDYMPMMDGFTNIFNASDIRFCNDANLNGGTEFGITGYPKFNSPTEFARDMGRVGCNMVNTGTNHSFDKTQKEIDASVTAWDKLPNMLAVAGQNRSTAEHDAVHYFTIKGLKFAFLAYTTYLNQDAPAQNDYGVNVFTKDFASKQITAAKAAGAQYIITSIRWGTEYSKDVTSAQKDTAQWLSDQGVDLVLGHGSHVLQPVDELKGANNKSTTVFYSLGNFLNTQIPPETLFNGLSIINLDPKTLQVTSLQFLPIYMHYEWTADEAKREDLLQRHNIKMYLLENATQSMVDANQLNTTIAAQKDRLQKTLNTYTTVKLITSSQYLNQ